MPPASAGDRALRHRVLEALAQCQRKAGVAQMYWSATDRWKLREATADASLRQRLAAVVRSVPDVKDLDDRMVVVGRPASGRI